MTFHELCHALDAKFEFFVLNKEFEIQMKDQALEFISEFVESDEFGFYSDVSYVFNMLFGYGDI